MQFSFTCPQTQLHFAIIKIVLLTFHSILQFWTLYTLKLLILDTLYPKLLNLSYLSPINDYIRKINEKKGDKN